MEWKFAMGRLMDRRDGVSTEPADGSSTGVEIAKPSEKDGAADKQEWDFVKHYLPLDFEDLKDLNIPYSLTAMLLRWENEGVSCNAFDPGAVIWAKPVNSN
jgi:hypothetical protein